MIKAVVFDLDGVLVDSEPVWEQVRRGLVAERGGHWAPDAQRRLMGMSTPEWARYLSEDLGVALPPDQVAAGAAGSIPTPDVAGLPAEEAAMVGRGQYLFTVASCALCHREGMASG